MYIYIYIGRMEKEVDTSMSVKDSGLKALKEASEAPGRPLANQRGKNMETKWQLLHTHLVHCVMGLRRITWERKRSMKCNCR